MTDKEVNERTNIILACFLCSVFSGLIIWIMSYWDPGWHQETASWRIVGIGALVTTSVVIVMFGREWYGD